MAALTALTGRMRSSVRPLPPVWCAVTRGPGVWWIASSVTGRGTAAMDQMRNVAVSCRHGSKRYLKCIHMLCVAYLADLMGLRLIFNWFHCVLLAKSSALEIKSRSGEWRLYTISPIFGQEVTYFQVAHFNSVIGVSGLLNSITMHPRGLHSFVQVKY